MAYGKPFKMPSAYTTPPCEYVAEVRLSNERVERAERELLLAVADYVLDTYQPTRAEKAERIRELMEKVGA